MTGQKEQANDLLGLNLPQKVVASAVGVSEAQISIWLGEEEFAAIVYEKRVKFLTAASSRDRVYDSVEDELLSKLKEKLDSGFAFTNIKEILAAVKVINSAVRRGAPAEFGHNGAAAPTVILQLPENTEFAARFMVNKENQVLEVAGRPLATMGAKSVIKKLDEFAKNREANAEHHAQDRADASSTLKKLVKMEFLPVAETL